MRRKRSSLGRSTSAARRAKRIRASQTNEERQASNEANRLRIANSRASESQDQYAARMERQRLYARSRASKSKDQHAARIERERLQATRSPRTVHVDMNLAAFQYDVNYDYSLHPSDGDNLKSVRDDISETTKPEVPEVCVEANENRCGEVAEKMRFRLLNILGKTLTPPFPCDSALETPTQDTNYSSDSESQYILPDRIDSDSEVETDPCEMKVKVEPDNSSESSAEYTNNGDLGASEYFVKEENSVEEVKVEPDNSSESSAEYTNNGDLGASEYFVKEENSVEEDLDDLTASEPFVKPENDAQEVSVPCKFVVGAIK